MDPEAKSFISCCLRKVPEKRLNIHKLLQHKFLRLDKQSKDVKPGDQAEDINQVIKSLCTSTFIETPKNQAIVMRDPESNHSTINTLSPNSERSHNIPKYNSDISKTTKGLKEWQRNKKNKGSVHDFSTQQFDSIKNPDTPKKFVFNTETKN